MDIYQILNTCKGHIEKFGGHPYAAGLTIKAEEYIGFKKAFEQAVSDIIKPEQESLPLTMIWKYLWIE